MGDAGGESGVTIVWVGVRVASSALRAGVD